MDRQAIDHLGIPDLSLMERAGTRAYRVLRATWSDRRRVIVFCGTGNNGGDGYMIASLAKLDGLEVEVFQLGDAQRLRGDAAIIAERYLELGGARRPFSEVTDTEGAVLVDALFGTGLDRPVEGDWRQAILAMNASPSPVMAVDIPSGLHGDTGAVLGVAVQADVTMTFIALKGGLFTGAGPGHVGRLRFDDLEVPDDARKDMEPAAWRVSYEHVRSLLAPRDRTGHKGRYGHVLVVGGDHGMGGAVLLAGMSALRGGAGLVSVATREHHVPGLLAGSPELMVHAMGRQPKLGPLLERASVVLVGPGLSRSQWGQALLTQALDSGKPLVLDADGLNLLSEQPRHQDEWVLTPHPGEAARLLGRSNSGIQADRFRAADDIVHQYGGAVALKGAGTVIAGGGVKPSVCDGGNPGMASGGTGDVLGGLIAALRGQGLDPRQAAEVGVCVHAEAGDRVARAGGERGLLASDLPSMIRTLVNP